MAENSSISCARGLGSGLRLARRGRYSQAELAGLIGTAQARLSRLESGSGSMGLLVEAVSALGLEIGGRSLPPGADIGERLAAARRRQGLGMRDLAEAAGISVAAVVALERDASRAHVRIIDAVARTLSVGLTLVPIGNSGTFYGGGVAHSSAHQAWHTPGELLTKLYAVFGPSFALDPCSPTKDRRLAPVLARRYITMDEDALVLSWHGSTVFVNPPYGKNLKYWISKARQEYEDKNASTIVMLIPARPDTAAWHQHIVNRAHIVMIRGRLSFTDDAGKTAPAPFPSALVIFGPTADHVDRLRRLFADSWHIPAGQDVGEPSSERQNA